MWSIDFTELSRRHPQFKDAFEAVEAWLNLMEDVQHLEVFRIISWKPDIGPEELSRALNIMVEEGILKRSYGVRAPDRTLAIEGFRDSPDKFPKKLHSSSDLVFRRNEGNVVLVYRKAVAR